MHRKIHAPAPAATGFILADAAWKPIYANPEAKRILTWPRNPSKFQVAWTPLRKRIFQVFTRVDPENPNYHSATQQRFSRAVPPNDQCNKMIFVDARPRAEVPSSIRSTMASHRKS